MDRLTDGQTDARQKNPQVFACRKQATQKIGVNLNMCMHLRRRKEVLNHFLNFLCVKGGVNLT